MTNATTLDAKAIRIDRLERRQRSLSISLVATAAIGLGLGIWVHSLQSRLDQMSHHFATEDLEIKSDDGLDITGIRLKYQVELGAYMAFIERFPCDNGLTDGTVRLSMGIDAKGDPSLTFFHQNAVVQRALTAGYAVPIDPPKDLRMGRLAIDLRTRPSGEARLVFCPAEGPSSNAYLGTGDPSHSYYPGKMFALLKDGYVVSQLP
jgi:hypothetical protein